MEWANTSSSESISRIHSTSASMHSSSELVPYVDATLPPDGLAIMRASIERTVLEAAAGRRVWVGESWPFGANRGSS